ncbi:MAG: hypothetical protein ACFB0B_12945 [Thermonemataceae bacterium]
MDIPALENELKKRWLYPYLWRQPQQNHLDEQTNFIYGTPSLEVVVAHLKKLPNQQKLFTYALNRWYNFWSAKAIEFMFTQHPSVIAHPNQKHPSIDFYLKGIGFDHKSTVFPRAYKGTLTQAKQQPQTLIQWLYRSQSKERRKHQRNRLFIVFYAQYQPHWQLKAELSWLQALIDQYLQGFTKSQLIQVAPQVWSDVIWAVR